jgi:hypothetical protein
MDARARYYLNARVLTPPSEPAHAHVGWHGFIDPRAVIAPGGPVLVTRGDARHPNAGDLVARARSAESPTGRAYDAAAQLKEAAVSSVCSAIAARDEDPAAQRQEERLSALVAMARAAAATATALAQRSALAQVPAADAATRALSAALDRVEQERESLASLCDRLLALDRTRSARAVPPLSVANGSAAESGHPAARETVLEESPGSRDARFAQWRVHITAMLDGAGAPRSPPPPPPSSPSFVSRAAAADEIDAALSRESNAELRRYTAARFAEATAGIRRDLHIAKQPSATAGTGLRVESVGNLLTVRDRAGRLRSATEFGSTGRVPSGNDFLRSGARAPRVGEQLLPAAASPMFLPPFDPYYSPSTLVTAQARKFFNADPIARYDGGRVLPQEPLPRSPFGGGL